MLVGWLEEEEEEEEEKLSLAAGPSLLANAAADLTSAAVRVKHLFISAPPARAQIIISPERTVSSLSSPSLALFSFFFLSFFLSSPFLFFRRVAFIIRLVAVNCTCRARKEVARVKSGNGD
jgi:hypothetical protein